MLFLKEGSFQTEVDARNVGMLLFNDLIAVINFTSTRDY